MLPSLSYNYSTLASIKNCCYWERGDCDKGTGIGRESKGNAGKGRAVMPYQTPGWSSGLHW